MSVLVSIKVDDKGNAALVNLGRNAKKAKPQIADLGDTMKKALAVVGVIQGLRLLTAQLHAAAQEANAFELAMKRLSAIGSVTGDALHHSREGVRQLALDTEHSASQIGSAMLEVVKMGYDAAGAMEVMPHATNLATAAMEDLTWSSTNMINVMKSFNIGSEESERMANVMATAFNKTSLNLKSYMESMTYVAPIASAMNVSFEETSALLGVLADRGLKGSIAGTTLKNAMLKLIDPTEKVMDALEGVDFTGMTLTQVLGRLQEAGLNTGEMLKQFDLRALAGALAIGKNADEVERLTESLVKQEDTAEDVANIIRQDYTVQLDNAKNALSDTVIELNELIAPYKIQMIRALGGGFRDAITYIEQNREGIRKFVSTLADLTEKVIPLLIKNAKTFLVIWGSIWAAKHLIALNNMWKSMQGLNGIMMNLVVQTLPNLKTKMLGVMTSIQMTTAAAALLYTAIDNALTKWEALLAKQELNIAEKFNTQEHLKLLNNYIKAEERLTEVRKKASQYLADSQDIKAAQDRYKRAREALKEMMGYSKAELDNTDYIRSTAVNIKTILDSEAAKKAKEDAVMVFDDTEIYGSVISSSPDGKGKGKSDGEETDPRIAAAEAELERAKMMAEQEKNYQKALEGRREKLAEIRELELQAEQDVLDAKKRVADLEEERRIRQRDQLLTLGHTIVDVYENVANIFITAEDARHERAMENIQEEIAANDRKFDRQITLAEGSLFKQQMLEQQQADERLKLEEKLEEKKKEAAKAEYQRQVWLAGVKAAMAVLDIWAREPAGFIGKTIAAAATAGITAGLVGKVAAANMRTGSGDVIRGQGNDSSDSILTRVSRGERVLSTDEIQRMGGNEALNQKIDLGDSFSGGRNTIVKIDNFVGTRQFARDFIKTVEKELSR